MSARKRPTARTILEAKDLKHPEKYKGVFPIVSRSRWELVFINFCDSNVDVLEWASEPYSIPYTDITTVDPKTMKPKQKLYVPDFLIAVRQANGSIMTMLIEIRPKHEALLTEAKSVRDRTAVMKNQAKWKAASWWCQRRGITFRIITEDELFGPTPPKPPRKKRSKK